MAGDFAHELRAARRKAKENLLTLAKAADVSIAYVSMVERGEKNPPSPEIIKKWLIALNCQARLAEFLELARTSVKSVKVSTVGKNQLATNVLTALARSYEEENIPDDVWLQLQEILDSSNGSKR